MKRRNNHAINKHLVNDRKLLISLWNPEWLCIYASQSVLDLFGKKSSSKLRVLGGLLSTQVANFTQKKIFAKNIRFQLNWEGTQFDVNCAVEKNGQVIKWYAITMQRCIQKVSNLQNPWESLKNTQITAESILDTISESFCVIDQNWKIRYWNYSAEITTGKKIDQVLGKDMWQVFPKEKNSELHIRCIEAFDGRKSKFDHKSITGTWYYNSVHPNDDGTITIYFKDITDRKNSEQEIFEIKNNLHTLLNSTEDFMWSVDKNMRLIFANDAFLNFLYMKTNRNALPGDLIVLGNIKGALHLKWLKIFRECLKGNPFNNDIDLIHERLTRVNPILDNTGKITGVACHSVDVSELRKLERVNIESAERFKAVVQNGSDLIFIFNCNYVLEFSSPSANDLFGKNVLFSGKLRLLIHQDDYQTIALTFKMNQNSNTFKLVPFRVKSSTGKWIWLEATVDNLLKNSAVSGIVINARDITDSVHKETELQHMVGELTRTNADLIQFSYIASHNLRSPLSNILGLLAHIERDMLDPDLQESLEMLDASGAHLQRTFDDLYQILSIRNRTNNQLRIIDINDSFKKAYLAFKESHQDIDISYSMNLSVTTIYFDTDYMESIFYELLTNANKFRNPKIPLKIKITAWIESNHRFLKFQDNGLGMDPALYQERLFGMYQRFHSGVEGRGMGLFKLQAQLKSVGATVLADSVQGNGTAFLIKFPQN